MRLSFLVALLNLTAAASTLTPVWLELGPGGAVLARTIVENASDCPVLKADGRALNMTARMPVPEGFKPVCEAIVPAGTRSVQAGKKRFPLAKTVNVVLVIGDTGCRVKGSQVQACDDPNLWPFEAVSVRVAAMKPGLVVHVGDYLYRETVCPGPIQGCGGPHGDNWETWNADFFKPARAALEAAPWVFARGNHESCERAYTGWFYYLDPRPYRAGDCQVFTDSYVAQTGGLRLGVLDTGATVEKGSPQPQQMKEDAAQLQTLSGRVDWMVDHHPFWGFVAASDGMLEAAGLTLEPAWALAQPKGVRLILSGHVHLFEFLALRGEGPNQVIAGDSGTQLDVGLMAARSGKRATGAVVKAGEVGLSFGFTELRRTKEGWTLRLHNAEGIAMLECQHADSEDASCRALRQ